MGAVGFIGRPLFLYFRKVCIFMRDSKLYKVLRIIFLTLAIISLVFALAKKVGLAAEDSSSGFLPFVCSSENFPEVSGYSYADFLEDVTALDFHSNYVCRAFLDNGLQVRIYVFSQTYNAIYSDLDGTEITTTQASLALSSSQDVYFGNAGYSNSVYVYRYHLSNNDLVSDSSQGYGLMTLTSSSAFCYCSPSPITSSVDNGYVFSLPDGGFDAPGWGDAFDEWIDDNLNPVDTSAPTNNTSTPAWLQKLLSALGTINNTVGAGFNIIKNTLQTIIDFFGTMFERIIQAVVDGFDSLFDVLERIFTRVGTTATNIHDAVVDFKDDVLDGWDGLLDFWAHLHEIVEWFYNHGLDEDHEWSFVVLFHYLFDFDTDVALTDFQSNKYGDFILDIRDFFSTLYTSLTSVTASDHVFFTIRLGNHFGVQVPDIVISFDWYASVRDTFLPYLFAFVYLSAGWLFFKRLPDIIHGAASAESSFADAFGNNEFAPTSHGVFTHGVSKHQPSLDKSPISGGGGVHSGSSQFWY